MAENLTLKDWNFDSDDELPACLLWEYGRESRSFTYRDDYYEATDLIKRKRWDVASQRWIINSSEERRYAKFQLEYLKEVGFDLMVFLQKYESFDPCYTRIYEAIRRHARPWSDPWQDLRPEYDGARNTVILAVLSNGLDYEGLASLAVALSTVSGVTENKGRERLL